MKEITRRILEDLLKNVTGKEKEPGDISEEEAPEGDENSSALKGLLSKLKGKEEVKMPKKDFEEEHTSLIDKLVKKDPIELDDEAKNQAGELADVEGEGDKEEPATAKGLAKLAILMMKKKKKE